MFYDNASGKFKAKEAGDLAAKNLIGSAGPANAVALPDGNTALVGTVDGTLEFVNDQLFIRQNGAWKTVTTAAYSGPADLQFSQAVLAGPQPEETTVGSFTCSGGTNPKTYSLIATSGHEADLDLFEIFEYTVVVKATKSLAENRTYYFTLKAANALSLTAACTVEVGAAAPVFVTVSITADDKTYDGFTTAVFHSSVTGVVEGDDVYTTGGTANFDTPEVGTGKTVTATGIQLAGADAGKYQGNTTATTTANITAVSGTAPTITSTSPVNVSEGSYNEYQFTATGDPAPTWSVESGNIPPNMNLSPEGLLSGSPFGGTVSATIKASNGVAPDATKNFTFISL